ncbi:hypothetical protein [Buttiauxella sp. B2]|nr:hypothetical protein [Buttiauxella sp. B2]
MGEFCHLRQITDLAPRPPEAVCKTATERGGLNAIAVGWASCQCAVDDV